MTSAARLRRALVACTPPLLRTAGGRLLERLPGPHPWRPVIELAPEGFPEGFDARTGGWNDPSVRRAYERKVEDFRLAVSGTGPLAVSPSPTRAAHLEGSLYDHNLALSYAYALALAAGGRPRVSILDWGGGVGLLALLAEAVLPDTEVEYHSRDLPLVCEAARELFPEHSFHEDDRCLDRRYDLVLASSSLQYCDDWHGVLEGLARATGRYLLVTRLPVVERAPSYVTVQRGRRLGLESDLVAWVLNRQELLACAGAAGLRLVREQLLGVSYRVRGAPEQARVRGFLLAPATSTGSP